MSDRGDRGPDLAEKLYYVLDDRLRVDWREVPHRPDCARDLAAASVEDEVATAPAARHNLRVGEISGGTAPVEIRLERVQPSDMPPVWLIARSLHGYTECLERLGRDAEATASRKRLDVAIARADVEIGASCFCRTEEHGCH